MTGKRRQYTEEFKRETVKLLESSGKPVARIARELGINENVLYRWRQQFGQSANGSKANMADLEAEVKRLRRENAVLKQERDVLKKAISIVSQERA
jgi:transposase